jgi:hypothetical protein
MMMEDLVAYSISTINIQRMLAINQNVALRVLFQGMRVDFWKELCLHFGGHCEVYNGMDNMSRSRSVPCIVLYPCNNAEFSWTFMNLASKTTIRRLQ